MKNADKLKVWFVTVFTAFNSLLGSLAVPFYILVGANVVDYVTGICAAVYRGEKVSSEVGFHGIAKKVCMWLLVMVGYVLDYCIVAVGHTVNVDIATGCLIGCGGVLAAGKRDYQYPGKYQRYRHTTAAVPFKAGGAGQGQNRGQCGREKGELIGQLHTIN